MSTASHGLLVDSDVLAEIRRPRPDPRLVAFLRRRSHRTLYVSVLAIGELRGLYPYPETERWLDELQERFGAHLLDVDAAVAREWAGRAAPESLLRTGNAPEGGWSGAAVEGLTAATATVHGLTVLSHRAETYRGWGVDAIDPWSED